MEKGFIPKIIACSKCRETKNTLYRVKGENGKKVKPAQYICAKCRV